MKKFKFKPLLEWVAVMRTYEKLDHSEFMARSESGEATLYDFLDQMDDLSYFSLFRFGADEDNFYHKVVETFPSFPLSEFKALASLAKQLLESDKDLRELFLLYKKLHSISDSIADVTGVHLKNGAEYGKFVGYVGAVMEQKIEGLWAWRFWPFDKLESV